MYQRPQLLNEDGTASMATMLLMSHHAFRRDIERFIEAVEQIKAGDAARADAVREEWEKSYRMALHGHHTMEDTHIFPDLEAKHPELAPALRALIEQHHKIDPVLERGDEAFADLAHPEKAEAVLGELKALLDEHLMYEETEITPFLREGKEFPMPPDEEAAAMYAGGFAWSMQGIAPEVIERVQAMLPEILTDKLPAAREAFEVHAARVWGPHATGSATTSLPAGY